MSDPQPAPGQDNPLLDPEFQGARGAKLYKLVKARIRVEPNSVRRGELEQLLADRRNFLEPLQGGAPTMFTLNGIGTRLYGAEEPRSDGTRIATLFFCLIYFPVVPIAQYLVSQVGPRRWSFYGSVPLSGPMRLWQRGLGLLALVATVGGISVAVHRSGHPEVRFVNALDVPVHIHIGKHDFDVAAGQHVTRTLASGPQRVKVTTLDSRVLEEELIQIGRAQDVAVYNVLGAAPLYYKPVFYSSSSAPPPSEDEHPPKFHCGERFIMLDDVDYVFVPPPKTIQMSERQTTVQRTSFDELPGGWETSLGILLNVTKQKPAAVKLMESVALTRPDDEKLLANAARFVVRQAGETEALALSDRLVASAPAAVEPRRLHQELLLAQGRRAELLESYRARAQAAPDSADAQYLYARVLPPREQLAAFENLLARFPEHRHIRRALAHSLVEGHRFGEALPHYEKLGDLENRVRMLIGLGRVAEAAELLAHALDGARERDDAQSYAWVARLLGKRAPHPPDFYLAKDDPMVRAWYACAIADEDPPQAVLDAVPNPELRATLALIAAARRSADAALAQLAKLPSAAPLPRTLTVLLAGELTRRGDQAGAAALMSEFAGTSAHRVLEAVVVRGEDTPALADEVAMLPLEARAAVELVKARRSRNAAERRRWLQAARADDLLHGEVTDAADHWR